MDSLDYWGITISLFRILLKLKPLTMLTREEIRFIWTEEWQEAFEILRDSLITEPLLVYPDFAKPFILTTDASGYALGQ